MMLVFSFCKSFYNSLSESKTVKTDHELQTQFTSETAKELMDMNTHDDKPSTPLAGSDNESPMIVDNVKKTEEIALLRKRQAEISAELVAEHFGFVPTEFVDDIINAINELIYQAMSELQIFVANELESEEEAERVRYTLILCFLLFVFWRLINIMNREWQLLKHF